MKSILVTGSQGFIGRNLRVALVRAGCKVLEYDVQDSPRDLTGFLGEADLIFHLAGVNRPQREEEYWEGNVGVTRRLCEALMALNRRVPIVLSSSIQVGLDNPDGRSKKAAEEVVLEYHRQSGASVYIYRFPNVFGKWSRPNYNSMVATFCYNMSRGMPVEIHNGATCIHLVYIDHVIRAFLDIAFRDEDRGSQTHYEIEPVYTSTVGAIHDLIRSFKEGREKCLIPDLSDPLVKYMYSTYVSFCEVNSLAYDVDLKKDNRGWLFELIKSPAAGQVFVSCTHPGVTRGNHYHDTKIEKFCVISGQGIIRVRLVYRNDVVEYVVDDNNIRIVEVPAGYTHSIENTGVSDMITLFWASEIFEADRADTHAEKVKREP